MGSAEKAIFRMYPALVSKLENQAAADVSEGLMGL
jgi:hypothetical protein